MHRLRGQLEGAEEPDRVGEVCVEALDKRPSFTSEVSGLQTTVHQVLAVLAGGGDRERIVQGISELHVRSAGGLM